MIKGTLGEKIFTYVDDEECYKIAPGNIALEVIIIIIKIRHRIIATQIHLD